MGLSGCERGQVLPHVDADDGIALCGEIVSHRDREADPAHIAAGHDDRPAEPRGGLIDRERQRLPTYGDVNLLRRTHDSGPGCRADQGTDQREEISKHG